MNQDSYKEIDMYQAVCFTCHTHSKHGELCPICRKDLIVLGKRAKIPKKNDKKGWEKLAQVYSRQYAQHLKNSS